MTNKEMVAKLQTIIDQHGELDVLIKTEHDSMMEATSIRVETSEGEYPDDWNMPAGLKFILID